VKFKSIVGLLALSFVVPTGVPVSAAQPAHPAKLTHRLVRHNDTACRVVCRQAVFGTSIEFGTSPSSVAIYTILASGA
jgi:hypothetical protein